MRAWPLNAGWSFRHLACPGEVAEAWTPVTLPHDAMLAEPRDELAPSGANSGWFMGRDYEYKRVLAVGPDLADKVLVLEFGGVYQRAEVWVDGVLVAMRPYGYTRFLVDITDAVGKGPQSEVRVVARNSAQPNSRWYSGAGIYRDVSLLVGPRSHICPDGISVRTVSVTPACVEVDVSCVGAGRVTIEISPVGKDKVLVSADATLDDAGAAHLTFEVPDAKLWGPGHPDLYECHVYFDAEDASHDDATTTFGIRSLEWGGEGLVLNGERIILKGACIHHDNGLVGACAFADAEERKVLLMQAQGYNALRSAHNPCSKALLDACDRHGMLVMDEYIDHWYIHKTHHDYVDCFDEWWRCDLEDMVAKDKNHPSVVLYSTGNEVSETAQRRGIELARQMTNHLHSLDQTRPVTCGVNIFFNFLSSIGLGQYSDEKAKREAEAADRLREQGKQPRRHAAVGSEFFNNLAGRLGAGFMKWGATLPFCDAVTRDAYAAMDIAGYNYGIDRYERDLKRYPDRLILGTETFCSDAFRFNELARKNPRLIGDFVWAGMDYMGEVAIGSWEYADYAPSQACFGWLTAGSGRVDLTGRPLGEALYTRVALGMEDGPYLAVCPVNHTGDKHSPSAWKMTNATDSWSWEGCEGRSAKVEVYARCAEVVLLINGREVGRRRPRRDCRVSFVCTYEPGTLEAVALDAAGREVGRRVLSSASDCLELRCEVDYVGSVAGGRMFGPRTFGPAGRAQDVSAEAGRLVFVRVRYTDDNGITKPLARGILHARVEGSRLVGFGCAAPYNPGSFLTGETDTYYGEALAILEAPSEPGGVLRLVVSDGEREAALEMPVVAPSSPSR